MQEGWGFQEKFAVWLPVWLRLATKIPADRRERIEEKGFEIRLTCCHYDRRRTECKRETPRRRGRPVWLHP